MNPYETDKLLSEYLLFHYGSPEQVVPAGFPEMIQFSTFPVRCVSETLQSDLVPANARALDIGCAVGRSSFELSRYCSEVVGVDFSQKFIAAAQSVRETGYAQFDRIEEGRLATRLQNFLPADIRRHRVRFLQGDAQCLSPDMGVFDVVLAANLIDRIREPLKFLRQLPGLMKPGGQLILTSPYTWLEEFTPATNWLGGFEQNERPFTTHERLEAELSDFILLSRKDLPFLIREHARKYQWCIAEATVWLRR
ncbi:MAG TPA: putative 4-mercaptohistidine N1-methyltransferase [Chthoniobacterales bacterium]